METLGLTPLHWKTITPCNKVVRPASRWGHSSCVVDNDLFIFGGFASN